MKTEKDVIDCLDNLNKLCLICLNENVNYALSSCDQLKWKDMNEKVTICTQIYLLNNVHLPQNICEDCCKELEIVNQFRMKCENSNTILRQIYQNYFNDADDKELVVKTENLDDKDKQDCDNVPENDSDNEPLAFDYPQQEEDSKDNLKDILSKVHITEVMSLNKEAVRMKKTKKAESRKSKNIHKSKDSVILDKVIKEEENVEIIQGEIVFETYKIENGKQIFICDICRKPLKDKRSIIRHITVQHSPEKMKEQIFKVTGYGAERRFHCSDCLHSTKRKIDMKIHSRVHSGHRPYVCDVCSRSFTQYGTLAGHKKTHSDTKYYTCQECGKQFKHRETLKSHQRVHSNEYNFVCKLCNKALKTEKSLTFHMNRHYRIKNHNCELCGATFVTRAELTKHKYSHESSKRFYCTHCSYSAHWRQSLNIHMRRHLKDKTVHCDQCEYSCYTKVELKLHKRKHSKEQHYSCPMCSEKFKQSTSVNKHMLSKHGQKFVWGNVADRRFIK